MKEYLFVPHLRQQSYECMKILNRISDLSLSKCILDGEIYVHGMPHQDIRSRIQQKKTPHQDEHVLEFHIFDIVTKEMDANSRAQLLQKLQNELKEKNIQLSHIKFAPHKFCSDEEEVNRFFREMRESGYEGLVLRQPDLYYVYKNRNNKMLKVKEYETTEALVIGGKAAESTSRDGCIVWHLRDLKTGTEFDCAQIGDVDYQRELYSNLSEHIGKIIEYKFYGRNKSGVPSMPGALDFRDPRDIQDYEQLITN